MKNIKNLVYQLCALFLLVPLLSFGQSVQEQFAGFGNVSSVTSLGGGLYTINITGFTGSPRFEINGAWTASDVASADVIFVDGARHVITLVNSAGGSTMNVRANNVDEGLGVSALTPGSTVAIGREFMGLFPMPRQGDNAGTGIPPSLASSIEIHNMKIMGNLGADYVTTDSFATFTNGITFSQIPLNKTIWRTTTGSLYEKTTPTTVLSRSTDDGENARLGFTQSGSTLVFNANLYNRVRLSSGNISTATIQKPSNYLSQATGENFLIGITSGNTALTVTWDTIFGTFNGSTFSAMPSTVIGQNSTIYFKFRTINPASEQTKFQYVDGTGDSGGTTYTASNGIDLDGTTFKWGDLYMLNQPAEFVAGRKINIGAFTTIFGSDADSTYLVYDVANRRYGFGITPTEWIHMDRSLNSLSRVMIQNTNGGTAAQAALGVQVDGNKRLTFTMNPTGFSGSGIGTALRGLISANGSGGLYLAAEDAAGVFGINTGGLLNNQTRLYINATGEVGIGDTPTAPQAPLHLLENNSATNTLVEVARKTLNSSGTVTTGFGLYERFGIEDASGNTDSEAARIAFAYTDASHGSEDVTFSLYQMKGGIMDTTFTVDSQGNIMAEGGLRDSDGDLGTVGQVFTSTGTLTNWANRSAFQAYTTTATLVPYHSGFYTVNGNGGAYTLTITTSGLSAGTTFEIKAYQVGTNNVTLDASTGGFIDVDANIASPQATWIYNTTSSYVFTWDGTNLHVH